MGCYPILILIAVLSFSPRAEAKWTDALVCFRDSVVSLFVKPTPTLFDPMIREVLIENYGKTATQVPVKILDSRSRKVIFEIPRRFTPKGRFAAKVSSHAWIGHDYVGLQYLRSIQKNLRHPIRIVDSELLSWSRMNEAEYSILKTEFAEGPTLFDYLVDPKVPAAARDRALSAYNTWIEELETELRRLGWDAKMRTPAYNEFPRSQMDADFKAHLAMQPKSLWINPDWLHLFASPDFCRRFDCAHAAIRKFKWLVDKKSEHEVPFLIKTDNLKVGKDGSLSLFDPL